MQCIHSLRRTIFQIKIYTNIGNGRSLHARLRIDAPAMLAEWPVYRGYMATNEAFHAYKPLRNAVPLSNLHDGFHAHAGAQEKQSCGNP